ncbi:transposable element Tcb2 transposase [Trichonephila clavipes]|uniref:Transposable element Tcb2 transposase n=1 Tax=Trichonephila clavipes TaxID=2585209 RepID=A0A8X6RY71_TRICX|nr:transposable element Tcb2 transposase [Trichonephila clavipes]
MTRKTTRREDRRTVRQALVDPTVTRSTTRADVGVAIVPQTISRHLAGANLKSKRPFRALPLTPEHPQMKLQWCQARSMWNVTDWQRLCLVMNPGLFWGQMISVYGCGGALGAIFQQYNARPHTARVAQDFLRHFQTLPWPARSPDLSPVEHVWDQLKRQMPSCHSVHDLELAVQDLWAHLPQDSIRGLINSMPDRVAACIAAGGTGEYFPPLQFTCRNCGGGDRGRVAIYRPFGEVSLSLNRTVTCMVLKANDRRTSCPCHDEFRRPRSDYVRQIWYPPGKIDVKNRTLFRALKAQTVLKNEQNVGFRCGLRERHSLAD